jgi:hypothetical protein
MTNSGAELIVEAYCNIHRMMLAFLQKRSDEELRWNMASGNPIAWHAWHVARWADNFQAAVPGMTVTLGERVGTGAQIWYSEGIAEKWELADIDLGYDQTGMDMPDEAARQLTFPERSMLLDYFERVLVAAERAVGAIDAKQFASQEQLQPMTEGIWGASTVGAALLSHVTHVYRHLGMMESLLGLQGQRGTATR